MWDYYRNSAADSLKACQYHAAEMKKANAYVIAYAHTKAMIFEAKSTLDSIAAALNNLFELGIIESHVFFNEEFIDKLNAQTRFPGIKKKHSQLVPVALHVAFVGPDHYFPQLRTYLCTSFAFLARANGGYLLSDAPGAFSFDPGVEAFQYCEKLLESVKYVFYFFNELIEDALSAETV